VPPPKVTGTVRDCTSFPAERYPLPVYICRVPDNRFEPDELSVVIIDRTVARRVLGYFRPYWSQVSTALVCLLAEVGVSLMFVLNWRLTIAELHRRQFEPQAVRVPPLSPV